MEETSPAGPPDEPADSAAIVRFLFAVAAAGGVEQRQLARDAGFPAPAAGDAMLTPGYALRLWELLEHALADSYYALRAAGLHRLGEMNPVQTAVAAWCARARAATGQPVAPVRVGFAQPATWQERFGQLLDEALDHGSPELDEVARRLFVSRRTLQRRLAEQGTSWRAELDNARRRRARANGGAPITPAGLARRLGYAAPRSARRALRRWDSQTS